MQTNAVNLRLNQYQSTMDTSHRVQHTGFMERQQKGDASERVRVSVVDDDESVRESLPDLLKEFGFDACTFSSAQEFLESGYANRSGCLILDIAMPGMTGLDLQKELQVRGNRIPIIFITAQTDVAVRARALEQGAIRVLLKPFNDTDLLDAVQAALRTN
jgi:FixJ family two-component response regulator